MPQLRGKSKRTKKKKDDDSKVNHDSSPIIDDKEEDQNKRKWPIQDPATLHHTTTETHNIDSNESNENKDISHNVDASFESPSSSKEDTKNEKDDTIMTMNIATKNTENKHSLDEKKNENIIEEKSEV